GVEVLGVLLLPAGRAVTEGKLKSSPTAISRAATSTVIPAVCERTIRTSAPLFLHVLKMVFPAVPAKCLMATQ
ncbi:hypothetical protein MJN76_31225, partial [Salmonella enterica subsp. enterica serovar Anatum]|nr:hypothetical protein [Salmonella enterica subsp. enterica serovar Anatum]